MSVGTCTVLVEHGPSLQKLLPQLLRYVHTPPRHLFPTLLNPFSLLPPPFLLHNHLKKLLLTLLPPFSNLLTGLLLPILRFLLRDGDLLIALGTVKSGNFVDGLGESGAVAEGAWGVGHFPPDVEFGVDALEHLHHVGNYGRL